MSTPWTLGNQLSGASPAKWLAMETPDVGQNAKDNLLWDNLSWDCLLWDTKPTSRCPLGEFLSDKAFGMIPSIILLHQGPELRRPSTACHYFESIANYTHSIHQIDESKYFSTLGNRIGRCLQSSSSVRTRPSHVMRPH